LQDLQFLGAIVPILPPVVSRKRNQDADDNDRQFPQRSGGDGSQG